MCIPPKNKRQEWSQNTILKGNGNLEGCTFIGMLLTKKGKMSTLIDAFAHIHELVHVVASGKIIKYTKFFFLRTLLSFHPNLDAFLLYTHVWPHIPREVITIGRCNISRPQVKVLPLLGIIETSEDWQILIYKGMLILCWNFRCHESGIFSF